MSAFVLEADHRLKAPPSGSAMPDVLEQTLAHLRGQYAPSYAAAQENFSQVISSHGLNFEGAAYPVSIRPMVLTPSSATRLAMIGEAFVNVLDKVARAYRALPNVRAAFPHYAGVERLARLLPPLQPLVTICRFDGIFDQTGIFKVLETNTDCPGGVIQNGLAGRLWDSFSNPLKDSISYSAASQPFVRDPELFLKALLNTYRREVGGEPKTVAIVNYKGRFTNEIEWMVEGFTRLGYTATIEDAAQLRRTPRGVLNAHGKKIDLAYNKLDLRDIVDAPEVEDYLQAAAEGSIVFVNPLVAQWTLADKGVLAVLSDAEQFDILSHADRELVDSHVPWTRFVNDSLTTVPGGAKMSLLRYLLEGREEIVLKPCNATRGEGVVVGRFANPAAWEELVARAQQTGGFVAQAYVRPPEISVIHPLTGRVEAMSAGVDVYVFGGKWAGFQSRASLDPVMNVGQRGVLLPVITAT